MFYEDEIFEEKCSNENVKEKHRKSRKASFIEEKKKDKRNKYSINYRLGKEDTKYCKKMSHKQNRKRLKNEDEKFTYRGNDYRLKQRYWDIT